MCCSTRPRRSERCRSVSSVGATFVISAGILGEEISCHSVAEQPPSVRQGQRVPRMLFAERYALSKTALFQPCDRLRVEGGGDARDRQRLVEPQAEHDAFLSLHGVRERLELALGPPTFAKRREVRREPRRGAPAPAANGRDRADPEAEVVAPTPVREVVSRAQIAADRIRLRDAAEVGRLVPAVAGSDERLDDALEVALHRLRLATELVPVRVREPRPGLRLELVAGEVLGPKRERLSYVGSEIGGPLPRNPVDEIQRDVVKSGIAKMVEGAPDVVRSGNAVEYAKQFGLERLGTERDAVDAVAAQERRELRCHRLRVRLDRDLGGTRQRRQQAFQLAGLGESRRAPAEED